MTFELDAAMRAEMVMPAMRAEALVSGAMPNVWRAIEQFRDNRESDLFLSWDEATDIVMGDECIDDYARWSFSPEGATFVPAEAEENRGYRMGKLIVATAGWRPVRTVCFLPSGTLGDLRGQSVSGAPVSLLLRLPQSSIYLPIHLSVGDAAGVFVYYEKISSPYGTTLQLDLLAIDRMGRPVFNYPIPLMGDTVTESDIMRPADSVNEGGAWSAENPAVQVMMLPFRTREEFMANALREVRLILNAVLHILSDKRS